MKMKHFLFKTIQLSKEKFRVFFSIAYLQNCKCSSLHNGKLQLNELTKMIFFNQSALFRPLCIYQIYRNSMTERFLIVKS